LDDGQGAALTPADKSWWPFGNPALTLPASYGFAIAHPILFMQEGTRVVTVVFHPVSRNWWRLLSAPVTKDNFIAELTGLKKWVQATITDFGVDDQGRLAFILQLETYGGSGDPL